MKSIVRKILNFFQKPPNRKSKEDFIKEYNNNGSIPWSIGYTQYKWQQIENSIGNPKILEEFKIENIRASFGIGVDERVIEYPWLMSRILPGKGKFLDAGSTFNFHLLLDHPVMQDKDIYIYTYHPEGNNFSNKRISYIYGDLRELPFKNDFFDHVVCHSTLEHIDMDNSIYGYDIAHQQDDLIKSYDYLKVIKDLERVVIPGGKIFLSFPYGIFENHGFFQQFDFEMVQRMEDVIASTCTYRKSFAKYELTGWKFVSQKDCNNSLSYNPHTGIGKGKDNAAHSRAICFMEILKNK